MAANINQITTDLRMMGDKQLQQYAAMHKNDPFIFPLAFQESQARQHLRAAQQAQMAGQPQPKVVDQDLMQMAPPAPAAQHVLPEEQGIGQLPAQNLQKMAEGGIVAFADGGGVTLPGGLGIYSQGAFNPQVGSIDNQSWAARKMDEIAQKVQNGTASPQEIAWVKAFGGDAMTRVSERERQAAYQNAPAQTTAEAVRLLEKNKVAAPAATSGADLLANSAATTTAAPSGVQTLASAPSVTNAAAPAGTGGISNLSADVPSTKGFMQQLEGYLGKREEAPKQADIERDLEERQKPYMDKLTESIESQRDKLKTSREESIYMAMIKGGFAAAAGTSPNALTNIAKGGEAGVADLAESMKDLRKAAQEQHKMELELTKAKMDASTGNLKTAWERQDKAKQIQADRDKIMATAFSNITDATIRSNATVKAAGIGAGADQRMLEALGGAESDSALVKGFNMKQEMLKRATLTETWSKLAYPTGNMGQPNEAFLARFPSAEVYIKEAMAAEQPTGGGGAPGPNAGMKRTR